jgi:hypothetical protein
MTITKSVSLSFPCNTLQLIGYTTSTYTYYNIYFPNINADSQLGCELIFLRTNGASLNSTASSSGLYIGRQGTNLIYNLSSSGSVQISTGINYVSNTQIYYKFIAFKTTGSQYGWLQLA